MSVSTRSWWTAVAVVALAGLGAMLPGMASAASPCAKKESKTVTASERARIYTQKGTGKDRGERIHVGCWFSSERRTRLFTGEPGVEDASQFRVAGRFVAFATVSADPTGDGDSASIEVYDLKAGKLTARHVVPQDTNDVGVTDIELKSNGSFAWIENAASSNPVAAKVRVKIRDRAGLRVLDEGVGIATRSLASSGSTLYWTHDGAPRSTNLD